MIIAENVVVCNHVGLFARRQATAGVGPLEHLAVPAVERRMIGRLATKVEVDVAGHLVAAAKTIVKVDAGARSVECNVAV